MKLFKRGFIRWIAVVSVLSLHSLQAGSLTQNRDPSEAPSPQDNQPASDVFPSNGLAPKPNQQTLPTIVVTAEAPVNQVNINPDLGTRVFRLDKAQIEALPQGIDTPFDQVVERTPGVSADAYGSWHVRGEDINTSYIINGVRLPQGIVNSTFGEKFDTRFISSVSLLDGALPARFGLSTGGIFDIKSKQGAELDGEEASVYGGSYDTIRPSFSYGGQSHNTDFYFEGSFDHNGIGIENPTNSASPLHDQTNQYKGFAYFCDNLDKSSQLIFIINGSDSDFDIPNTPGISVGYSLPNTSTFASSTLNETQNEQFDYGIVSYKTTVDDIQIQTSLINSYARTLFRPDPIGDLLINGVATEQNRSLLENTATSDITYQLNEYHTLRAGAYFTSQTESAVSNTRAFPTDPTTGAVVTNIPETIEDGQYKQGNLYGYYLEDEWQAAEPLTVTYGVRFDQVDEYVSENQVSPRFNLVLKLDATTAFHAGFSRFFTPPQLEFVPPSSVKKYADTTAAPSVTADDNVHSERSSYYDIGVTKQVTKSWQLGSEIYYKSIRNYADEAQVGDSLIYTPFSYARGYYVGTELTSSYTSNGFNVYSNLEVNQAEAQDLNSSQFLFGQDKINYIAQHDIHVNHDQFITLSTGASYSFLNTTLHVDTIFSSGFYDGFANSNKVPSHHPINLGVEHNFFFGKANLLSIRFDVVNILDEIYLIHHGDGIGTTAPYYGERRGFFGGVTYHF